MRLADGWTEYQIIATGGGLKLESWGNIILLRPDPQVIWPQSFDLPAYPHLSAAYLRDNAGGGRWSIKNKLPDDWTVSYKGVKFSLKAMGFKHTGLFPEQAVNWEQMSALIKQANRPKENPVRVLNLFGYTGAASVYCSLAGAAVTHVDASKGMCERAGINAKLNGVGNIRYIVDDCFKFVQKEIKRGKTYDAVLMDPPSYGRGPSGELWKLEDSLYGLVKETSKLMSDDPLFFLINSYTTGLQPTVLSNIISLCFLNAKKTEAYEVGLPTQEKNIILPCGASGLATF